MPEQLIPVEPPPSYEEARKSPAPDSKGTSTTKRPPPGPPPPLNLPALNDLRKSRVVLASASPRRRQLLAQIGLTNIDVIPSKFPENLSHDLGALNYVLETASAKARDVYMVEVNNKERGEPAIVIAADTIIVSHDGLIMEKPRSEAAHFTMLKMLRDQGSHKVMTAMAVMRPLEAAVAPGYKMETYVEETTVVFDKQVSDELIHAYVRTRDGNDKAGGYGIQTAGSILIERIEGSYDNVVGLPLRSLLRLIEKVMSPAEEEEGGDDLFVDSTEDQD